MGVLGLVPFIQKYCPEVIKELPHRLKTLSGKTIAIDGTLITQRLHFSPMPCPNRHVLGWHRIVRELQAADVGVICVFDGDERSSAKKPETDRRRKTHRMHLARGAMEADRLQRLQNLTKLLIQYQNLPDDEKDRSADALRKIIHNVHTYDVSRQVQFPKCPNSCVSQQTNMSLSDAVAQKDINKDQTVRSTNMPMDIFNDTWDAEDVVKDLASLFKKYEENLPIIMATPLVDASTDGSQDDTDANVTEQYAMSKNQMQLTIEEGRLWKLFAGRASQQDLAGAEEILDELARRSESLAKSYEVRNNPVTPQMYEESKYILQVMGVPCIDANLPYEAEALAASLVHNGYADYVASEDTDVLVYEAPLLRNITNRQAPLTILSGADVRRVLRLDRASYIDFALLLGTDFSQRVKNVGPNKAIKLIREYGRIEEVIANEPKFSARIPLETYLNQVATARVVFETLPPPPDPSLLQPTETSDEVVAAVLAEFGVYRASLPDWNYSAALEGNYFNDNPRIS
ncbi:PIN domain-like protein [Hysterangium stoloniferum]|nr:PIN domain-like protein [Hysterangium stoloniferum]